MGKFPGVTRLVTHCRTREQAVELREEITRRLTECKLTVHPEKTKVVYCRDGNRREKYERTEFDFLGYTFRPRMVRSRVGAYFLSFTPAVSRKAKQAMKAEMRSWKIYRMFQRILVKWVRNKYKRVKRSWKKAAELLRKMALARPNLSEHWTRGWYAIG